MSSSQALEVALHARHLERDDLRQILLADAPAQMTMTQQAAEKVLLAHCGDTVKLRGLIEFSNYCVSDCLYCGIRKSNPAPERYLLPMDDVLASARQIAELGYGSLVLQSGERQDRKFVEYVVEAVKAIKQTTRSERLPNGLGITLCVGEQPRENYERFFEAGAHRYLLRIETSSPALFARLHPPTQRFEARVACLKTLREVGFMVGTGVMIGLPGQTVDHLVDDLLFFRDMDVDMIGMGPYIPHAQAALPGNDGIPSVAERLGLALRMIAAARLLLRDVNIAATTALQAIAPDGSEQGLRFGANVIMPQVTPQQVRRNYTLYDGKPCLDDSAGQCAACLTHRIRGVGRRIAHDEWGDSLHFAHRTGAARIDIKTVAHADTAARP